MMEVSEKDKLHANDPEQEIVANDEWEEVYDILTQVIKSNFYTDWITEESGSNIELNPQDFWSSLKEPDQGNWSPSYLSSLLIDPEGIGIKGLPEFTGGQQARNFFANRTNELETDLLQIRTLRESSGVNTAIEWALGIRNVGDPPLPDINQLIIDISSSDISVVELAETSVRDNLFMIVDDLKRMMSIISKLNTDSLPTEEEWNEVYTILNSAQKKKRRIPVWITEETAINFKYWQAYKARLSKWRGSFEQRAIWKMGLKRRSEAPIVDPNILFPVDFTSVDPATNAAYQLYLNRKQTITNYINTLRNDVSSQATPLAGIEFIITKVIDVPISVIDGINDAQALGEDIRPRLTQLQLTRESFEKLLVIRLQTQLGNPILDSEWDEVYHILARVWKERQFRIWQIEEETQEITHSQDFFKEYKPDYSSFPMPEPLQTIEWISKPRERRVWLRKIKSRINQEETTESAIQNTLEDTAELTLKVLRDAIVKALDKTPKYLSDHLLIDVENNCCQKMTRVSLAMESLQILLWSLHIGILEDTYPDITLEANSFEEEWQWIGSYGTWRAAMFVFIYPENILIPSLRKWQSPGFRSMVGSMRRNRRLNPEQACEYAKEYTNYYKDICNLEVQSTCTTRTKIMGVSCKDKSVKDYRCLFYKFAVSQTKKIYWSIYDQNNNSGYADSFWATVPGIEHDILEICGSPAYAYDEDQRHIFLFLKYKDGRDTKFGYTKYNLENLTWDGGIEELEVPKKAFHFKVVSIQTPGENRSPQLVIKIFDSEESVYNGAYYKRDLNDKAEDWQEGEWNDFQIVTARKGRQYDLNSAVQNRDDEFVVIFDNVHYRLFGAHDDGEIRSYKSSGVSLGATYWRDSRSVYAFYDDSTGNTKYKEIYSSLSNPYSRSISSIAELDEWLEEVFGLSLKQHALTDPQGLAIKNMLENFANIEISSIYDFFEFVEDHSAILIAVIPPNILGWFIHSYAFNLITWLVEEDSELFERLPDWRFMNQEFKTLSDQSNLGIALIFLIRHQTSFSVRERDVSNEVRSQQGWSEISKLAKDYGVNIGKKITNKNIAFHRKFNTKISWRRSLTKSGINLTSANGGIQLTPTISSYYEIPEILTESELPIRKSTIEQFFIVNQGVPTVVLDYLREAYYFVPVHLALQLQNKSHYISSLNYFKTVYDYTRPDLTERKIYYGLVEEESLSPGFDRAEDWMLDPLNPHAIASSRANIYTTFTKLAIARCLLEYGDAEFTYDTAESVPRARNLYEEALELLACLKPEEGECDALIGMLNIEISDGEWQTYWDGIVYEIGAITDIGLRVQIVDQVLDTIQDDTRMLPERFETIDRILDSARSVISPTTIISVIENNNTLLDSTYLSLSTTPLVDNTTVRLQSNVQLEYAWKQQSVTGKEISELMKLRGPEVALSTIEEIRTTSLLETSYAPILANAVIAHPVQAAELAGSYVTSYVPRPFITQFCIPPNPIIIGAMPQRRIESVQD